MKKVLSVMAAVLVLISAASVLIFYSPLARDALAKRVATAPLGRDPECTDRKSVYAWAARQRHSDTRPTYL